MTIKAHFDGKVFVPDEPVNLPTGEEVTVQLPAQGSPGLTAGELLERIRSDPKISEMWERIAAGRDSVEVARELRRRAERRRNT